MAADAKTLTVGSTFTGVGGADLGLEWAGFRVAWQCELDPWKQSVLQAHWPDTPLHADITTLQNPKPVDVLMGGFPCQDLSVAGKRKGFDGARSVLAFEFLRLAESIQPRWLLLENVPGLLSSNRGRDFARLIDEVAECGYGVAWRILDARYFNVPQRRRRIFLVARRADVGDDPRGAAELALRALREGGSGDTTPGWPPRPNTSAGAGTGAPLSSGEALGFYSKGGAMDGFANYGNASGPLMRTNPMAVSYRKSKRAQSDQDDETWVEADETNTLNRFDTGDTRATQIITAFAQNQREEVRDLGNHAGALTGQGTHQQTFIAETTSAQAAHSLVPFNAEFSNQAAPGGDQMHTLDRNANAAIASPMSVRRLTPVECERLMGWPDNWTAPDGVKAPDSKRYAACGDGIVSWVAYWIGQRIRMIEEETR